MYSIFMNSENNNSKTLDSCRFVLDLTVKIGLKRNNKYITL